MKKSEYRRIGWMLHRHDPKLAEMLLTSLNVSQILTDYKDIQVIKDVFSEYYQISFPDGLSRFTDKARAYCHVKFTTVCLLCFDQQTIQGPYFKKIKNNLRGEISAKIGINPTMVSQHMSKARVYIRAYPEFEAEVYQLVALVKERIAQRN